MVNYIHLLHRQTLRLERSLWIFVAMASWLLCLLCLSKTPGEFTIALWLIVVEVFLAGCVISFAVYPVLEYCTSYAEREDALQECIKYKCSRICLIPRPNEPWGVRFLQLLNGRIYRRLPKNN